MKVPCVHCGHFVADILQYGKSAVGGLGLKRKFTSINSQFSEVRYSSVAFAISPSAYISIWTWILTYRIVKDVLLRTKHDYLNDITI